MLFQVIRQALFNLSSPLIVSVLNHQHRFVERISPKVGIGKPFGCQGPEGACRHAHRREGSGQGCDGGAREGRALANQVVLGSMLGAREGWCEYGGFGGFGGDGIGAVRPRIRLTRGSQRRESIRGSPVQILSYGSNMLLRRMLERAPSVKVIGIARLEGFALNWHKRSGDGSGKCDVQETERSLDVV